MCFLIFTLLSTMDWYLEVRIQARDIQFFAYWSQRQRASRSWKDRLHVVHNTCTVLRRNIKTWYFGLILILRFEEDWHSIRLDRMQSSFREHFQLIVFQNLWDWRLEKSYMRNHTFSSTTTKDLIATRSRLDQREISIGFYSWSTARR